MVLTQRGEYMKKKKYIPKQIFRMYNFKDRDWT